MEPDTVAQSVGIDDVKAARTRIAARIRTTPMLRKDTLARRFGHPIHVKCEHLQRTGSFKLRGATNLIAQLSGDERARGFVAASAGNHAQGVAVAAADAGARCTIFMPEGASLSKVEATKGYGADVQLVGENLSQALDAAQAFASEQGAVFVHPFDDSRIVAGQGTVGLEIVEQVPDVEAVVVPVGGGGLASGIAVAVRALRPSCRIIAVQASACRSLEASQLAGRPVVVEAAPTLADGIAVKSPGHLNLAILDRTVDDLVHVEEEEIAAAILWYLERAKQVVEGAGSAALAALLADRIDVRGPTVVLACGGNIDPMAVMPVIRYGLTTAGRFLHVGTVIPDRPGELSRLLGLLADLAVNILSIEHHREGVRMRVSDTQVDLTLQTRNHDHVREVLDALAAAGYRVQAT